MCKFSSKSEGVPFQPLGDLTWNDPSSILLSENANKLIFIKHNKQYYTITVTG